MTDDKIQDLKDDIAFMRALANDGQRTPLLGGAILTGAGLIFAIASVAYWAILTRVVEVDQGWGSLIVWGSAGLAFTILLTLVNRRIGAKPGANSPANRATGAAWMGVGLSIFFIFLSYAAAAWQFRTEAILATFPSVIFALYGAGWVVASSVTGRKWLFWVGLASWFTAPLLAWISGETYLYLVYAAALILLMTVPGYLILRAEPTETV